MAEPFDYAELADDVSEILEEFGAPAVLRDALSSATYTVTAVLLNYTQRERDRGNMVGFVDRKAVVSVKNLPVVPDSEKHELLVGGIKYRIISVKHVRPATTDIVYVLQVRR
jgi:hypothetical protein